MKKENNFRNILKALFVWTLIILLVGCNQSKLTNTDMNTQTVTVAKNKATVQFYGTDEKIDTYNINGNIYIKLTDISSLFNTKTIYKNNMITIGDNTRANTVFFIPDLSGYPNLEDVIGLPPYEFVSSGIDGVYFKYVTKAVSFKDMIKKIDQKLKLDSFKITTKEEFTEIINGLSQFRQGKLENTYIKYKNKELDPTYVIQIIDGGFDKNKMPIIIVKMKD